MRVGDAFGVHRLLVFRFVSLLAFACVVVLTYFVSARFARSQIVGFLAGAILIGYEGYGARAATAFEPKAAMLLFGLACLLALQKRKWFWAGALGALAGLAWQIAWGYLIVALLLAFAQGGSTWQARARALGMTFAAACVVFGIYILYFAAHNALTEMFQQTILSPALMHSVAARKLLARINQLTRTFQVGYAAHTGFGVLGFVGFFVWVLVHLAPWQWRGFARRAFYFFVMHRRTAGVLLAASGFTAYLFIDFQNYPDWIPVLPYLALFAAWLLYASLARVLQFLKASSRVQRAAFAVLAAFVLLFSVAHAFYAPAIDKQMRSTTWQMQERAALELNQRISADAPVWIVGKAELLFFMQRHNLNKYIYVLGNADAAADAFEPGGFKQVVHSALAQKPVLIVTARLQKRKFSRPENFTALQNATKNFIALRSCKTFGSANFYVARAAADTLFPKNAQGCVKQ